METGYEGYRVSKSNSQFSTLQIATANVLYHRSTREYGHRSERNRTCLLPRYSGKTSRSPKNNDRESRVTDWLAVQLGTFDAGVKWQDPAVACGAVQYEMGSSRFRLVD